MRVSEVFKSIQGEGVRVGIPAVFVRLQGCNFFPGGCVYCDTQYAADPGSGRDMSVGAIIKEVISYVCSYVCISGGEPLLQGREVGTLVSSLKERDRLVEIETNGSIEPPSWFKLVECWSVDVKCPSSGSSYGSFRTKWLRRMRSRDQLKFVVGTEGDLDFVRGFLNGTRLRPTVLISPVVLEAVFSSALGIATREWLRRVAEFCKEQDVRFSLQIHKVLWGNRKGV